MYIKGTGIAALSLFVKEKFGQTGLEKWMSSLSPDAQQIYKEEILLSKWYSLTETYSEPIKVVCQLFYNGDLQGAREVGRHNASFGLKGIYAMFVKLGSPAFIIKQAARIFSTYFSSGVLILVGSTEHSAVARIMEFSEMNDYVEQEIGGFMERSLEINGCKEVKLSITKSSAKGDSYTEYKVSWV